MAPHNFVDWSLLHLLAVVASSLVADSCKLASVVDTLGIAAGHVDSSFSNESLTKQIHQNMQK